MNERSLDRMAEAIAILRSEPPREGANPMTEDQTKDTAATPEASAASDTASSAKAADSTTAAAARSGTSSRRVLAALFWLLASLAIMVGSVTLWAHQTLLTSDGWGGIVEDVIADPEVTDNISTVVVTRISDSLGVRDTVADILPGSLDIVAGALTTGVEDRIVDAVAGFMASDGFQEAFVRANEVAHDVAMKAIRGGDSEALTSEDGLITLNVFPIIEAVLLNLQDGGLIDESREIPDLSTYEPPAETVARLETLLGREIPDDIGTIVLVESEGLGVVQEVVRYFDIITVLMLLLAVLFVGLALWLSASRVRMVLWLAGGAIAALAVGRFFTRLILNAITDKAQEGDASVTVLAIVDAAVDSLMWFTFVVMAISAIVALAAIWWERHKTGERAATETPPRTLGHWARDNAQMLLFVGIGTIAFIVIWNIGGADLALLTAAGLGLLGVAYKVLTGHDDSAPADDTSPAADG
jgi:hypothetical protein